MSTETSTRRYGNEEKPDFFVKRTKNLAPNEFRNDVLSIEKKIREMSRKDILTKYMEIHTKSVEIVPVKPSIVLIKSTDLYEAVQKGYLAPSMFVKYRRCARELTIEIMEVKKNGGVLVSIDHLRSFLKGILVHKLFYEKYSIGDTEVKVISKKHSITGYIDEVRKELDTYKIIEIKSSRRPDLVGAGLQVMAYMLALSDQKNIPMKNIEGYIITLTGTYKVVFDERIYSEYTKRVKKIIELALRSNVESLPPRLSMNLEHRCVSCPYRGLCLTLPDNFRSYSRFFEAMGFEKLYEKKRPNSLDKFL